MLVLSRKARDTINIADGLITIQVVAIKGNVVRIGIHAPRDVSVLRGELPKNVEPKQKAIQHQAIRLTLEEAYAQYREWLTDCNWAPRPSLLYWWFITERAPDANRASEDFCDAFEDFKQGKRILYGSLVDTAINKAG